MSLTDVLRSYTGGYPAADLWECFQKLVRRELRRRRMWRQPPRYLDYPEFARWTDEGAVEALAIDAFQFALIQRWENLKRRLDNGENIDGHLIRNIRNFLTKRQKDHDPCGYAGYKNVEKCIRQLVKDETLIANPSLPRLGQTASPATTLRTKRTRESAVAATAEELQRALLNRPGWPSTLPHLVRCSKVGQRELAVLLSELGGDGIRCFLLRDLVEVVKSEVRTYGKRFRDPTPAQRRETDTNHVELELDAPGMNGQLIDCIRSRIAGIRREEKRTRIQAVFAELVRCWLEDPHDLPKQSELGRLLGIARQRVSEAYDFLRTSIAKCQSHGEPSEARAPRSRPETSGPGRKKTEKNSSQAGHKPGRRVKGN